MGNRPKQELIMKITGYIIFLFLFLLSCQSGGKKETAECVPVKDQTKLDRLFLLPFDSVMNAYDLSNRRYTVPSSFREVDLSYNFLDSIRITEPLRRIILSHNNLIFIGLNQERIQYLDVSCNIRLNRLVRFEPLLIDTIISEGVAGGKHLIGPISKNAGYRME